MASRPNRWRPQAKCAVGGDAQPQVEAVEFKPPHPDVKQRRCERIEANLAARRRKDGSAGGVTHRQAREPETQPHEYA